MSQEIYNFRGNPIRVVLIGNEPHFVAKDVADLLGYSDTQAMTRRLRPGTTKSYTDTTSGQARNITVLTEPALYRSIFGSEKDFADDFQEWLASEVLPSIRKHGMYATDSTVEAMLNDPDVMIKALVALKEERIAKINAQLEAKEARESETKALEARDAADAKEKHAMSLVGTITEAPSEENLLLREVSKKFQSLGWDCNESKLRTALLKPGVLMKGSRGITATSKALSAGLCVVGNKLGEKVTQNNMTGWSGEVLTPRFTAKGVMFIGKNLGKLGFKQETQTIEFLDLELPGE